MRITLDANILVRAIVSATGPAKKLLEVVQSDRAHTLVLSSHIVEEVKRVLAYPRLQSKYRLTAEEIQRTADVLEQAAEIVEPTVPGPVVLTDPDDDPVLYTAVEGDVDVLCTLNRDFYEPNVVAFCRERGIAVMSDVELLRELAAKK